MSYSSKQHKSSSVQCSPFILCTTSMPVEDLLHSKRNHLALTMRCSSARHCLPRYGRVFAEEITYLSCSGGKLNAAKKLYIICRISFSLPFVARCAALFVLDALSWVRESKRKLNCNIRGPFYEKLQGVTFLN